MRAMKRAEVRLDEPALWTIPADKMKRRKIGKINGRPHLVPLPRQAVQILKEIHPLTGSGIICAKKALTMRRMSLA